MVVCGDAPVVPEEPAVHQSRRSGRSRRHAAGVLAAVATTVLPLAAQPAQAAPDGTQVVISELRFRGPTGGNDEFVELRNPTSEAIDISGWRLQGCNTGGTVGDRAVVPAGTTIPAGGSYLFANASTGTGGSYSEPVAPDQTYTTGVSDNGGVRLANQGGGVVDQVGAAGTQPCKEGSGITGIPTANGENAYERLGGATDTDDNAVDLAGPKVADPQAAGHQPDPDPDPAGCGDAPTAQISEVQGPGSATPIAGQTRRVEGVVTGRYGRGITIEDPTPDADPATSDGIFVFSDTLKESAVTGDLVRLTGRASEFNGLTQLSLTAGSFAVCSSGHPLPLTTLSFPTDLEQVEGRRVAVVDDVVVSELFELRFGEIGVRVADEVPSTPTDVLDPQEDAAEVAARIELARRTTFNIDDDTPAGAAFVKPFEQIGSLRLGDRFTGGVVGVMDFGFSSWRLQVERAPTGFEDLTTRPAAPPSVGGDVQVASFNVLNYFTVLNTCSSSQPSPPCPRGANTAAELERQRAKTVAAIRGLGAEVVGLVEMQNDQAVGAPAGAGVQDLVAALDDQDGAGAWGYVLGPAPGSDAIQQAFVYRTEAVEPVGPPVNDQDPVHNRPPLAQRFSPAGGGTPFTVVVNHFKSKGCGGATGPDTDQADGQACFNATRVAQARALDAFVRSLGGDALVIGDLNSYAQEDPIDELRSLGYQDLETPGSSYSYLFDGQVGRLDHALATAPAAARVTGTGTWHINADEPSLYDYDNPSAAPDPYRSSDHDPVLIGLDLTGPAIDWTGDRTYTVDELVSVSCSARDRWLPVASTTCPALVSGPAFGLPLGTHTASATATDAAGNATVSEASFTVRVDIPSLRAVVVQLVSDETVQRVLLDRLDEASRRDGPARAGALKSFRSYVDAKEAKELDTSTAAVLRRLVDAL